MGHRLDCVKPALGESVPEDWQDYDGLIVFGGPMSVNDQTSGVLAELALVDQWLSASKPYLGVCLGAQMMVKLAGGRVGPCPQGQVQMGWHPVTPIDPDFQGLDHVYQWHREWMDPTAHFDILAIDPKDRIQALGRDRHWGIQFHPEANASVRSEWISRVGHPLEGEGAQPIEVHQSLGEKYDPSVQSWLDEYLSKWTGLGG